MTTPAEPHDRGAERSPQLQALEAQLAALRPREDRLDRERLMYLAGQASVGGVVAPRLHEPRRWAWPASLGALAGAAAAAVAILLARPVPTTDVVSATPPVPRQVDVVVEPPGGDWARGVAADLTVLRDLNGDRLLTAGMALRPAPRVLVAAVRQEPTGEIPAEAPAPQPRLTTRSVGELLAPSGASEFSS